MKKLIPAAVVLSAAAAALALPAAAGQVDRVPTSIEVWGAQVADAPPERGTEPDFRVYGRVFSPRAKCTRLRRIDLFTVRDGSKIKIGSGFSDTQGRWSINASKGAFQTSVVYAKTPKLRRGKIVCKADRSPNFEIL